MHGPEIVSATLLQSKTKIEIKDKKISSLIVFDSSIKSESCNEFTAENVVDDEKLIYYYPSSDSKLIKHQQMSLVEGLISMSSLIIGCGELINYVKTRQHEIVFKKIKDSEIAVCIVMQLPHYIKIQSGEVVDIEFIEDDIYDKQNSKISSDYSDYLPHQFRNNSKCINPAQEENNREPLLSILDKFIETFTLLHGEVMNIEKKYLIYILEDFVPAFIETIDLNTLSITTSMNGFYFAPVERQVQISIINLVENIINNNNQVSHISILFDAHMLYSTLDSLSSRVLYNYLVMHNGIAMNDKLCNVPYGRFPTASSLEKRGGFSAFGRSNKFSVDGFIFGPTSTNGQKSKGNLVFSPKIFLPCTQQKWYKLLAFTYNEIMVVILLRTEFDTKSVDYNFDEEKSSEINQDLQFCIDLKNHIIDCNGGLSELYGQIFEQFMNIMNSTDSFRFFYINKSNSAIRRSNRLLGTTKTLMSSAEGDCVLRATRMINSSDNINSFVFKSSNEGWIVCRKSLDRTFYLFFEDSKIPLSKILGKLNHLL
ncbi:uncharacterized protein cubi_02274 [Cryptosporidium ubiquitum]|uniref:CCZ1/INTU/HSP4 first Longin domain-containing protein n=1 Tax=Cryptosporidium ubiquitum TaxID=857276 RepID=A0A1J4MHW4_9CRYT|nr:uncharacterized protein cubi_02274 [Cryptosporidium ubiquitum]OII73043.1 hypothetical protein cubi_02274 [Cryptosporidium ubiquitum]